MASISAKDERNLHVKSGNRCALCRTVLVENTVCIGENAHIFGGKPGSARYDASKSSEYVNSEANHIFLCRNCHKIIDTNVLEYPPGELLSMKADHESRVIKALQEGAIQYTFAELQVITSFLIQEGGKVAGKTNYNLLRLPDKIQRNQLKDVQGYIDVGLLSVAQIEDYLNRHPDPRYADKLTSIFVDKYVSLQAEESDQVNIFNLLWDFACNNQVEYSYRSAGLAILVYFFEKCEVFEK